MSMIDFIVLYWNQAVGEAVLNPDSSGKQPSIANIWCFPEKDELPFLSLAPPVVFTDQPK